jgi:hypothetical protein
MALGVDRPLNGGDTTSMTEGAMPEAADRRPDLEQQGAAGRDSTGSAIWGSMLRFYLKIFSAKNGFVKKSPKT